MDDIDRTHLCVLKPFLDSFRVQHCEPYCDARICFESWKTQKSSVNCTQHCQKVVGFPPIFATVEIAVWFSYSTKTVIILNEKSCEGQIQELLNKYVVLVDFC